MIFLPKSQPYGALCLIIGTLLVSHSLAVGGRLRGHRSLATETQHQNQQHQQQPHERSLLTMFENMETELHIHTAPLETESQHAVQSLPSLATSPEVRSGNSVMDPRGPTVLTDSSSTNTNSNAALTLDEPEQQHVTMQQEMEKIKAIREEPKSLYYRHADPNNTNENRNGSNDDNGNKSSRQKSGSASKVKGSNRNSRSASQKTASATYAPNKSAPDDIMDDPEESSQDQDYSAPPEAPGKNDDDKGPPAKAGNSRKQSSNNNNNSKNNGGGSKSSGGNKQGGPTRAATLTEIKVGFDFQVPSTRTNGADPPSNDEYAQLATVTSKMYDYLFRAYFDDIDEVGFQSTDRLAIYEVISPYTVVFTVAAYFDADLSLPSDEQLAEISVAALRQDSSYYKYYLYMLQEMDASNVFSETQQISFYTQSSYLTNFGGSNSAGSSKDNHTFVVIIPIVVMVVLSVVAAMLYMNWVESQEVYDDEDCYYNDEEEEEEDKGQAVKKKEGSEKRFAGEPTEPSETYISHSDDHDYADASSLSEASAKFVDDYSFQDLRGGMKVQISPRALYQRFNLKQHSPRRGFQEVSLSCDEDDDDDDEDQSIEFNDEGDDSGISSNLDRKHGIPPETETDAEEDLPITELMENFARVLNSAALRDSTLDDDDDDDKSDASKGSKADKQTEGKAQNPDEAEVQAMLKLDTLLQGMNERGNPHQNSRETAFESEAEADTVPEEKLPALSVPPVETTVDSTLAAFPEDVVSGQEQENEDGENNDDSLVITFPAPDQTQDVDDEYEEMTVESELSSDADDYDEETIGEDDDSLKYKQDHRMKPEVQRAVKTGQTRSKEELCDVSLAGEAAADGKELASSCKALSGQQPTLGREEGERTASRESVTTVVHENKGLTLQERKSFEEEASSDSQNDEKQATKLSRIDPSPLVNLVKSGAIICATKNAEDEATDEDDPSKFAAGKLRDFWEKKQAKEPSRPTQEKTLVPHQRNNQTTALGGIQESDTVSKIPIAHNIVSNMETESVAQSTPADSAVPNEVTDETAASAEAIVDVDPSNLAGGNLRDFWEKKTGTKKQGNLHDFWEQQTKRKK